MSSLLIVRHEGLAAWVACLQTAQAGIERDLDELQAALHALSDRWEGAAREAFFDAQHRWRCSIDEMQTILDDAKDIAALASERHRVAESRAVSHW